jgi:hypothetical protein
VTLQPHPDDRADIRLRVLRVDDSEIADKEG